MFYVEVQMGISTQYYVAEFFLHNSTDGVPSLSYYEVIAAVIILSHVGHPYWDLLDRLYMPLGSL